MSFKKLLIGLFIFGIGLGAAFGGGTAWGATLGGGKAANSGSGFAANGAAGMTRQGQGNQNATFGTVEKVDGNTITVTTQQGSTKVNLSQDTNIMAMQKASPSDIKAGARVTVTGDKQSDGSIKATSVQVLGDQAAQGATGGQGAQGAQGGNRSGAAGGSRQAGGSGGAGGNSGGNAGASAGGQ